MSRSRKKTISKKRLLLATGALLIGVAVAFTLMYVMSHARKGTRSGTQVNLTSSSQSTKGERSGAASDSSPGATKQNTAPAAMLVQPTGNFVSAHKNVPVTASLSSVCNTSSGATCQIVFTSGSESHSLPAQTTDLGGSTYWNSWTPESIGLTPGSWTIKAVATLGSDTKSNTDALMLEVAP